jgi:flagellar motility protein MotE (MotC chaperone)
MHKKIIALRGVEATTAQPETLAEYIAKNPILKLAGPAYEQIAPVTIPEDFKAQVKTAVSDVAFSDQDKTDVQRVVGRIAIPQDFWKRPEVKFLLTVAAENKAELAAVHAQTKTEGGVFYTTYVADIQRDLVLLFLGPSSKRLSSGARSGLLKAIWLLKDSGPSAQRSFVQDLVAGGVRPKNHSDTVAESLEQCGTQLRTDALKAISDVLRKTKSEQTIEGVIKNSLTEMKLNMAKKCFAELFSGIDTEHAQEYKEFLAYLAVDHSELGVPNQYGISVYGDSFREKEQEILAFFNGNYCIPEIVTNIGITITPYLRGYYDFETTESQRAAMPIGQAYENVFISLGLSTDDIEADLKVKIGVKLDDMSSYPRESIQAQPRIVEALLRSHGFIKPITEFTKVDALEFRELRYLWAQLREKNRLDLIQELILPINSEQIGALFNVASPGVVATILTSMPSAREMRLLAEMDTGGAGGILAAMDTDRAVGILGSMPFEREVRILENMPFDKAGEILENMPPAREMRILAAMDPGRAGGILAWMYPPEKAGEILESMSPAREMRILAEMDTGGVGGLLERMPFKKAVKILAEMDPPERASRILAEMDPGRAGEILAERDPERASENLAEMDLKSAGKILERMTSAREMIILGKMYPGKAGEILAAMDPDRAVGILRKLAPNVTSLPLLISCLEESKQMEEAVKAAVIRIMNEEKNENTATDYRLYKRDGYQLVGRFNENAQLIGVGFFRYDGDPKIHKVKYSDGQVKRTKSQRRFVFKSSIPIGIQDDLLGTKRIPPA